MAKKCVKKSLFEEEKEIEIQAEPRTIMPMVDEVARESSRHNFYFEARQAPVQGLKVTYNVLIAEPAKIGATEKRPIGAFTLHKLDSNRTMLTVLPRSRWGEGNLTPMELSILAYSGDEYDEYFRQFIRSLDDKLKHYGIKATWYKRLWYWIESHRLLSILGAIASIATIVGVIIACLNYLS